MYSVQCTFGVSNGRGEFDFVDAGDYFGGGGGKEQGGLGLWLQNAWIDWCCGLVDRPKVISQR